MVVLIAHWAFSFLPQCTASDHTFSKVLFIEVDEGASYLPLLSLTMMLGYGHQHKILFSLFFAIMLKDCCGYFVGRCWYRWHRYSLFLMLWPK